MQGATDDTKDVEKSKEGTGSTNSTTRIRAVYELTAVIAHVHDEFDTDKSFQEESEGHLVAHVKVIHVLLANISLLSNHILLEFERFACYLLYDRLFLTTRHA